MKNLATSIFWTFCFCLMLGFQANAKIVVPTAKDATEVKSTKKLSLKERIAIKKLKKIAQKQKTAKKKRIALNIIGGALLAALGFFFILASALSASATMIIVSLLVGLAGVFFFIRGIVWWMNGR